MLEPTSAGVATRSGGRELSEDWKKGKGESLVAGVVEGRLVGRGMLCLGCGVPELTPHVSRGPRQIRILVYARAQPAETERFLYGYATYLPPPHSLSAKFSSPPPPPRPSASPPASGSGPFILHHRSSFLSDKRKGGSKN